MRIGTLSAVVIVAAMLSWALAQESSPNEPRDPNACVQGNATTGSNGDTPTGDQSSLSEKLARSNGVICPPDHVDPAIKAPTPQGGRMPVIPPPGSSGGNQSVQPK
ncbi:MAG TPA: hypothetical protein VFS63_15405 [Pseudolabrys sp.]|jgi:hypothetical protein|nr:hypothetical protein [Pseudolabrys sp.]